MNEQLLIAIESATGLRRADLQIIVRMPLEIQSNELYDVYFADRHLIAKYFLKPDEVTTAPVREYNSLQLLVPYDIAPQPIFYDPAVAPVVIYEYLAGTMWDRHKPTADQLTRLAQLWLTMHRIPTSNLWPSRGWERTTAEIMAAFRQHFEDYAGWAVDHFPPGNTAIALCLAQLAHLPSIFQQISAADPQLCFCRADPRFANVIERPDGRLACVDWEDSGLRDPARDLADLLTHPNQEDLLTVAEWQAFLQPYWAARTAIDPTVQQRMHLYLAIFPLFWLAICLSIGVKLATKETTAGWQINGLPANLRLRRYLARSIAWPATDFSEQLAQMTDLQFFPTGK